MMWPVEFPLIHLIRRRRPADWQPLAGERVLHFPGGGYPMRSVLILRLAVEPGKDLAAWRHGGHFIAPVSRDRLYPYPNWRETRARDQSDALEEATLAAMEF